MQSFRFETDPLFVLLYSYLAILAIILIVHLVCALLCAIVRWRVHALQKVRPN